MSKNATNRTAFVNALRVTQPFRYTSFRLLADLYDWLVDKKSPQTGEGYVDATPVLVLRGQVSIDGEHSAEARRSAVYWPEQPRFIDRTPETGHRPVYVSADPDTEYIPLGNMPKTHEASFSLFASLDLRGWPEYADLARSKPPPLHKIWVTQQAGLGAPVEALTHLLAASVARDFNEPVAIVRMGHEIELSIWSHGEFVPVPLARNDGGSCLDAICEDLQNRREKFFHVFFVNPSEPQKVPGKVGGLRVHRIVYLADHLPDEIPSALEKRIVCQARNLNDPSAPYFCSFIPTLIGRAREESAPFSRPIFDDDSVPPPTADRNRRLNRDLCRLPFDAQTLWEDWNETHRRESFASDLLNNGRGRKSSYAEIASRWARSVTNRTVGLALSGGGASSYRIVPLIDSLDEKHVPIDIVSGISGGALFGAYYCKEGRDGLGKCIRNGTLFQLVLLAATLDSRAVRWCVNRDLGGAQVADLERRFVPLSTALCRDEPPMPHVICGGTVGEAVQASGAAAGLFSPAEWRDKETGEVTRYVDGAVSRLIPALVLPEYGADMVIAFNTVPGPARRNPFGDFKIGGYPLGELLYERTPAGRLIDVWVSAAFLVERCSSEVAEDANVFIQPMPLEEPFFEAFNFQNARSIVSNKRDRKLLRDKAAESLTHWQRMCQYSAIPD